jgi:hypothetical protein
LSGVTLFAACCCVVTRVWPCAGWPASLWHHVQAAPPCGQGRGAASAPPSRPAARRLQPQPAVCVCACQGAQRLGSSCPPVPKAIQPVCVHAAALWQAVALRITRHALCVCGWASVDATAAVVVAVVRHHSALPGVGFVQYASCILSIPVWYWAWGLGRGQGGRNE